MLETWLYMLASVGVVSLVSLIGLVAGARFLTRHLVILALVAVAAGSLLGDALLHLIPEAAEAWGGFSIEVSTLVIAGFLAFFILESALRWQHAHAEVMDTSADAHGHGPAAGHASHQHGHARVHAVGAGPAPSKAGSTAPAHVAPFAWMNLVGDGVHNFLDGVVIAAAYLVDVPLGIATTIAVALHEIPQELGDYAVLIRAGLTRRRAIAYNFLTALTALVGGALFLLLPFDAGVLEAYALPLTAGGFLYIAAADLIPELHHHTGERHALLIFAGMVTGIAIMFLLLSVG